MPRNRFPLNVHSEISMANEGISPKTKKQMIIVGLTGVALVIAWAFQQFFKDTQFSVLAGFIGLLIGIGVSSFVYQHFVVDKMAEQFEDSKANKIFKFFKLTMASEFDSKELGSVELSRYLSGTYAAALSLSIGNITYSGEQIAESFLDQLFLLVHKQKVKMKIFVVRDEWETSETHLMFLKRLSKLNDTKLRNTLAKIDAHQSSIYKESSVNKIVIMFLAPNNKLASVNAIISFVSEWQKESLKLSSIRSCNWCTRTEVIKLCCDYLGTKMIDISPIGNKEDKVLLDIRKMLRPYSAEKFFAQTHNQQVEIDTNARYLRHSSFTKTKGGKK